MIRKGYVEKRKVLSEPPTATEFLEYLENLNQEDWYDIVEDIIHAPSDSRIVFAPPPGDELLPYVSTFLQQLSRLSRALALEAIQASLRRLLIDQSEPSTREQAIQDFLFLLVPLSTEADTSLIRQMVLDRSLAPESRTAAAAALAETCDRSHLYFWQSLDLSEAPFLSSVVFTALTEVAPREAVDLLPKLSGVAPEELAYPLQTLLSKASRDESVEEVLAESFATLPADVQALLRANRLFDENRYAPRPVLAPVIASPYLSVWAAFCKEAVESGAIDYSYSHYSEGNIFSHDPTIPTCLREYLIAVRAEIVASLPKEEPKPRSLRLNRVVIGDLAEYLSSIWSGEILLAEVAYATRTRGKKIGLIRVGEIPVLSVVGDADVCKEFGDYLGVDLTPDGGARVTFSTLIDVCMANNIKFIVQVGTDISDLLEEYRTEKTRNLGDAIVRLFLEESQAIRIDDPGAISKILPGGRYLALLDTIVGLDVQGRTDNLARFAVKHDAPLPVGFPVPSRDKEFATHLFRAVQKSLFSKNGWNKDFRKLMDKSNIVLDPEPSFVIFEQDQWLEVKIKAA